MPSPWFGRLPTIADALEAIRYDHFVIVRGTGTPVEVHQGMAFLATPTLSAKPHARRLISAAVAGSGKVD
jgi:hypothetical protein